MQPRPRCKTGLLTRAPQGVDLRSVGLVDRCRQLLNRYFRLPRLRLPPTVVPFTQVWTSGLLGNLRQWPFRVWGCGDFRDPVLAMLCFRAELPPFAGWGFCRRLLRVWEDLLLVVGTSLADEVVSCVRKDWYKATISMVIRIAVGTAASGFMPRPERTAAVTTKITLSDRQPDFQLMYVPMLQLA